MGRWDEWCNMVELQHNKDDYEHVENKHDHKHKQDDHMHKLQLAKVIE
jgi:hypothetical protein